MLRRDVFIVFIVLIAAVEWVASAGCREQAAIATHAVQAQTGSSAAVPINEHRHATRNGTHPRPSRSDALHQSFQSTYNNPEEGVSFRYPRNYFLEEGEVQEHSFFLQRQEDLDSEQPGAKLVATILIPEDAYPNTTFEHGSLQLTIRDAETGNGCTEMSAVETTRNDSRAVTEQGIVLRWSEQETEIAGTKILQRQYAGYSQGTCYQFRLTVAAEELTDPDGFNKAADMVRIMKQLESIVASSHFSARPPAPPAEISSQADRL
jgi:hypothetical protein